MTRTRSASGGFPAISTLELHEKVARYRTAVVVLLDMVKRDGSYMSGPDQNIIRQIERILVEDAS